MSDIYIKQNIIKISMIIIINISICVFAIFGIIKIYDNYDVVYEFGMSSLLRNKGKSLVALISGLLFAVFATIVFAYRLFRVRNFLVITRTGFRYTTMNKEVSWDNVSVIQCDYMFNQVYIGVSFKSPTTVQNSTTWFDRKVLMMNHAMCRYDLFISLWLVSKDKEYVISQMLKYWNDWKQNNEKYKSIDK